MEVMKKTIDSMFRNCTQQEREALEDWPVFSDEDVTELNDLFDHYIFYQWETKRPCGCGPAAATGKRQSTGSAGFRHRRSTT